MLLDPCGPRFLRLDEAQMDTAAAIEHDSEAEGIEDSTGDDEEHRGHRCDFQEASEHARAVYRFACHANPPSAGVT
jgi:hypothetical protein